MMISNRDFVFTGLQPWDLPIGSNARDIAMEVSRNNRVLYVNTPLVKWSRELKSTRPELSYRIKVLQKQELPIRKIHENLFVLDCPFTLLPMNKLPDGILFDYINKLCNRAIFDFVKQIVIDLGFKDIIHFIDNDIYRSFYSKEFLKPHLSIYYRRDNLLTFDFWKRHAVRLEPLLIGKSDLVLCNSANLANKARPYNPNTYDIGQGLDLSAYHESEYPIPEDIRPIPRPIVGYLGHITSLRLDTELIYQLAKNNPSLSFVLVGSIDEVFRNHPMNHLSNLHFLGSKPTQSVPLYINAFDVCMNPQVVNEITIGNYPRKIDEYLALGKPTVATKTDTMQMFSDYVSLCSSVDEYSLAIRLLLQNDTLEEVNKRKTFAHTHTWEASVNAMYKTINQYNNLSDIS